MSSDDIDVQLELKERLRYPEYLEKVIQNINEALNSDKISISKVQLMIVNLLHDIPRSWYDEEFVNDIKGLIRQKEIPNIVEWAGVPLSHEYMKEHGIALTKKINDVDYFGLKNAIINLLDRLNMLVRKDKIEKATGKNLEKTLDDLTDELEDETIIEV